MATFAFQPFLLHVVFANVSDLRQSRRLEIVNRSKRVNLGAAQSGFRLRTVPTDPGVGLPSLALG